MKCESYYARYKCHRILYSLYIIHALCESEMKHRINLGTIRSDKLNHAFSYFSYFPLSKFAGRMTRFEPWWNVGLKKFCSFNQSLCVNRQNKCSLVTWFNSNPNLNNRWIVSNDSDSINNCFSGEQTVAATVDASHCYWMNNISNCSVHLAIIQSIHSIQSSIISRQH